MKITRVSVVDGRAIVSLDSVETPIVIGDGHTLSISDDGEAETMWLEGDGDRIAVAKTPHLHGIPW